MTPPLPKSADIFVTAGVYTGILAVPAWLWGPLSWDTLVVWAVVDLVLALLILVGLSLLGRA